MKPTDMIPASRAAFRLRLTADSLRRRIQAGKIPGEIFGGLYFMRRDDLERLEAAGGSPTRLNRLGPAKETR